MREKAAGEVAALEIVASGVSNLVTTIEEGVTHATSSTAKNIALISGANQETAKDVEAIVTDATGVALSLIPGEKALGAACKSAKALKATGLVKKTKPIASSSSTAVKKPLASSSNSGRVKQKQNVDKWSREPKSIQDQMALDAAKRGDPTAKNLEIPLGDPRYKGMKKMRLKIDSKEGKQSVIHYVEDPKTGKRMDFKFKKHSTE